MWVSYARFLRGAPPDRTGTPIFRILVKERLRTMKWLLVRERPESDFPKSPISFQDSQAALPAEATNELLDE
jgi:hypothetical protein